MPLPEAVSPPKAKPIQYAAPLGTRWDKEKATAPKGAFDFATDPDSIGPWVIGECVGKGASGRVKVARHAQTGQMAAVKILPLDAVISSRLSLRSRDLKAEKHRTGIDREIIMMKLMDHPNIVRIYDVFEGDKELFLILEYVQGGELFDYLVNHGRMEPMKGLMYFKQIIYGLSYAHAFSIIHRDLKPENILIHSLKPPRIKIADWGMAAFAPPSHQLETSCGSPHYASPEIVHGKRYSGTATDIWSCGVILYALMTGRLPFDDKNIKILLGKVKSGKYEIPSYVHPEAADLIRRMLVVDVDKRIKMAEILAHPFLKHATPGITYVSAPSISELDQPLRSRVYIKPDLLRSLLVIYGGATFDEMAIELLSAPGQGSLVKALYFLLNKHRERTLEDYSIQGVSERDDSKIKHYAAPPVKDGRGIPSDMTVSSGTSGTGSVAGTSGTDDNSTVRAIRTAPAAPSPTALAPPTYAEAAGAPEPSSPGRTSSSRIRPPSPIGPRTPSMPPPPSPAPVQRARPVSTPNPRHGHQLHLSNDSDSRVTATRARAPTVDGMPAPRLGLFGITSPRTVLQSPNPIAGVGPGQSPLLPSVLPYQTPRIDDRPPQLPPVGTHQAGWVIEAPTVENPDLQAAIDSIAGRFNVLVAQRNFLNVATPGQGTAEPGGEGTSVRAVPGTSVVDVPSQNGRRASGLAAAATGSVHDKENYSCNGSSGGAASRSDSIVSSFASDRRMDVDTPKEKTQGKKARSNHAEMYNPRRATMHTSLPARGLSYTQRSTSPTPSPGGSGVSLLTGAPAVVGEFKGWFANLFNWKAQQYVLHSVDNCLTTRDECARLLEYFGCHVVLEDAQGWGQLRCRVDEQYDLHTGGVTLKSVRFRVEFSPVLGYTQPPQQRHSLSVTPTPSTSGARAPRAGGKGAAPFASTLVLVQEKGALSTFRHVYQRLRAEWRLDALRSPDIGGATPLVGATPRLR